MSPHVMNRRTDISAASAVPAAASWWLSLAEQPAFDWDEVASRLPFAAGMRTCIQDPTYHAEGDVWTHTVAVVEQLRRLRAEAAVSGGASQHSGSAPRRLDRLSSLAVRLAGQRRSITLPVHGFSMGCRRGAKIR